MSVTNLTVDSMKEVITAMISKSKPGDTPYSYYDFNASYEPDPSIEVQRTQDRNVAIAAARRYVYFDTDIENIRFICDLPRIWTFALLNARQQKGATDEFIHCYVTAFVEEWQRRWVRDRLTEDPPSMVPDTSDVTSTAASKTFKRLSV